jgi:glycosyltransferase involved in cell wall biosynthesis
MTWPFVSVVIPVFNDADYLEKVLNALHEQDYPPDRYEIIVVDNGSKDRSADVARSAKDVRLLFETDRLGSPYSARNRGIEASQGEVIALLDATCRPAPHWMRSGIQRLREENGDLLGGNVQFEYDGCVTPGKIFDAITNMKMKEYVEERQVATTGNLFVRRVVVTEEGLFPEGVRSGGDLRWTGAAARAGWRLVYGPDTTIYKPARSLGSLLRKQFRVAKGQPEIWREEGDYSVLVKIVKDLIGPVPLQVVEDKIDRRGKEFMYDYLYRIWFVHYLVKIVMGAGRIYGLMRSDANGKEDSSPSSRKQYS